ncbi:MULTISPECIES: DUF697 domain-containing protein [unclassified Leptolyngbya]|uniref:slr1306 family protein n=1 Tax=unclassified Leptolyngbya TaxID=2650499 RepID=UPI00168525A2|nr:MULTISPECIES: DUF697 domain-containing protein [unclassified Leptolyngbya]MBD1910967.1 DUF697 domain-containing protein [Leptolyngbya sp. FACHB-8]MBD2158366.1 DUF697 domain-containing protein [Leptolyngbya sp. FACHB-16]
MGQGIRQPILIGGLALTAGTWVLNWIHPGAAHMGESMMWGAIALGSGMWWLQRPRASKLDLSPAPVILDRATVEKSLATADHWLTRLKAEVETPGTTSNVLPGLQERLTALQTELERQNLRVAIAGSRASGKTTLLNYLQQQGIPQPTETPRPIELFDLATDAVSSELVSADLVLFLITGDLTDSDLALLKQLQQQHYRVVLAFNKQDQYLPDERPLILQQIRERALGVVSVQDVVAIAAAPAPFKVRQHQANGTISERLEQPQPELASLLERLEAIVTVDAPRLVLATTDRQARHLKDEIKAEVNRIRRDRALPVIEQAQWIAATAAFASPVPSLDLLATASINAQLVMDLGSMYQQKVSLEQAKNAASTLAEAMVKLGLVELTSQAITPLLKSHALTFVAGGALQGVSAAYLTRMAGLSLIEYFQEQEALEATSGGLQLDRLAQKLSWVFQENQRSAFAQTLVNQALQRLKPQANTTLASAEASA